jgi:hypothetical protein
MTGWEERLGAAVRRVIAAADPVPTGVAAAARSAYDWRDPDAALAALVADSRTAGAGLRGEPAAARLLSFEAGERAVDLDVSDGGPGLRIAGQLAPAGPARVRVEQPESTVEVVADGLGRFTVAALAPAYTRLVCQPLAADGRPAGPPLRTEWIRL